MNLADWLGERTVYVVEAGSHAYGTSTPTSDFDYRGAAIPPENYFLGLDNFEQSDSPSTAQIIASGIKKEFPKDSDMTIWSLKKMIQLASDGNPNMIELLFTDENNIVFINEKVMRPFFDVRDAFLSKLLKHRFSGYAMQVRHEVVNSNL